MGWYKAPGCEPVRMSDGKSRRSTFKSQYILKDCPKCGAKQENRRVILWGAFANEDHKGWSVICSDCLYYPGRLCATEQEAVDLWNGGEE